MRLALPPPADTHLAPGASHGFAVRPGAVIVCRAGRIVLSLPAPGLADFPGELRLVLRAGETFVAEDAGWLRCAAVGPALVRHVPAPRPGWPRWLRLPRWLGRSGEQRRAS